MQAARAASTVVSRNPATQQFVQAGLTAGASFLMGKFRQMHVQAMGEGEPQPGVALAAASSASATSGSSTVSADAAQVEQLRKADAAAKSAALQTDKVSCQPALVGAAEAA